MPRTGRPKAELVLTDDEREQLLRWSRRRKSSQALALRSRIVLACAEGADNKAVAASLGCSAATVGKWRSRFVEDVGRAGRRGPSGSAADGDRAAGGGRGGGHVGVHAGQRDALVAGEDGAADWVEHVHDRADLEVLRPQTAPGRRVQAVQRPAVRGEGLRRRRALPGPARGRGGAVGGREVPSSGPVPVPAGLRR
jgi:DNA-binding CsgD family transcriptional regulator